MVVNVRSDAARRATHRILVLLVFGFQRRFLFYAVLLVRALSNLRRGNVRSFLVVVPVRALILRGLVRFSVVRGGVFV